MSAQHTDVKVGSCQPKSWNLLLRSWGGLPTSGCLHAQRGEACRCLGRGNKGGHDLTSQWLGSLGQEEKKSSSCILQRRRLVVDWWVSCCGVDVRDWWSWKRIKQSQWCPHLPNHDPRQVNFWLGLVQSVHRSSDNPVRTLQETDHGKGALPTTAKKGMKTCASYEMPMQADTASVLVHVISGSEWRAGVKNLHTSTQCATNDSDSSWLQGLPPLIRTAYLYSRHAVLSCLPH